MIDFASPWLRTQRDEADDMMMEPLFPTGDSLEGRQTRRAIESVIDSVTSRLFGPVPPPEARTTGGLSSLLTPTNLLIAGGALLLLTSSRNPGRRRHRNPCHWRRNPPREVHNALTALEHHGWHLTRRLHGHVERWRCAKHCPLGTLLIDWRNGTYSFPTVDGRSTVGRYPLRGLDEYLDAHMNVHKTSRRKS